MINIFEDHYWPINGKSRWEVWSDTPEQSKDGRCIGVGKTEKEAVEQAMNELGEELAQLRLTWETL